MTTAVCWFLWVSIPTKKVFKWSTAIQLLLGYYIHHQAVPIVGALTRIIPFTVSDDGMEMGDSL